MTDADTERRLQALEDFARRFRQNGGEAILSGGLFQPVTEPLAGTRTVAARAGHGHPAAASSGGATDMSLPSRYVISTHRSPEFPTGDQGGSSTAITFPAANLAFFIPFALGEQTTITQLFLHNGAVISGNLDLGIYTGAGALIVSMGTTAMAGANLIQLYDIANTILARGVYYLAIACDNTTGTFTVPTSLLAGRWLSAAGCLEMAAAFPLPGAATMVALSTWTAQNMLVCGLLAGGPNVI